MFLKNIDFLEFPGISIFPAHVSWHSRKIKIIPEHQLIVIAKNPKGQVARTSRLARTTLWVRAVLGHLEHFFPVLQLLTHIWVKSCRTGKKCSKCPKTALTQRVVLAKRLVLATCPFGFLAITMSWCSGMIFIFLECQETCAGNIEIPGNSRKSIFFKNIRKKA